MKRLANPMTIATALLLVLSLGRTLPAQETEVEIRRGEVLQVAGTSVLLRVEGEGVKRYTIPRDFRFNYEGSEITVNDLREGMILSGVRLRTTGASEAEDITSAMEEIAETPTAEGMTAGEAAELSESTETPAGAMASEPAEAASAEAPAAAPAAETVAQEAASSEEGAGMSPALIVGIVLLVLIVILLAAKGMASPEGKKAKGRK